MARLDQRKNCAEGKEAQSARGASGLNLSAPQLSDFLKPLNSPSCDVDLKTLGADRNHLEGGLGDEIVEFFGQLWAIPGSERVRVPNPNRDRGCLVWVRKELVRETKVGI
jgi:hypothetical protein